MKTKRKIRPSLPNLIALPIPQQKPVSSRNRRPIPDGNTPPPGVLEAADALSSVIALVHGFISKYESYAQTKEWLEEIDSTIEAIENSIVEDWFDENPTDNSENIDTLRKLADHDFEDQIKSAANEMLRKVCISNRHAA